MIDLAQNAARKFATPPKVDDVDETQLYEYFCTKILPNSLPIVELRAKILLKSSESESQLQLKILSSVENLNAILADKKPTDLFNDRACIVLYNNIRELQISQHFAGCGWKVVCFPCLVPMIGKIFVYTAGVFHTRKCPLFLSWSLSQKVHPDENFIPSSNLFTDECVDQQSPLVKKPTPLDKKDVDWPIENGLENLDQSLGSNSSSVDSGRTLVPSFPMMDAKDISNINLEPGENSDETTYDSYLDISFVNPKRRLNLSRKDKIDILDGPSSSKYSASSPHSTPVRSPNVPKPKFTSTFKKTQKPMKKLNNPGYIQKFLDRWFRSQMANITAELKNEINQMD